MHRIAMLGTGLIGCFYTMTLQNFRGKGEIKVVCSSKKDYDSQHFLIKEEKMPDDKLKVILKDKQTGKISQIIQ